MSLNLNAARNTKIRMAVLSAAAMALGTYCSNANASVIAQYTFANSALSAQTVDAGLSASSVSSINSTAFTFPAGAAAGSGSPAASLTNFYSGNNASNIATTNNGFLVTFTIPTGFQLELDSVTLFSQASATGPALLNLIINGTNDGSFTNPTAFGSVASSVPLTLTGLTGTVTVDLVGGGTAAGFATNGSSTTGSSGTLRLDDLTFNGSVTPTSSVPEPASVGIVAAGAAVLIGRRRRAR